MHMVWLNRQLQDRPAFLLKVLSDEVVASLPNRVHQNAPSLLGTPDHMIHHQVSMVFIVLLFHLDTLQHDGTPVKWQPASGSSHDAHCMPSRAADCAATACFLSRNGEVGTRFISPSSFISPPPCFSSTHPEIGQTSSRIRTDIQKFGDVFRLF